MTGAPTLPRGEAVVAGMVESRLGELVDMADAPIFPRGEVSALGTEQRGKNAATKDAAMRGAPTKRRREVYALGMEQHGQRRLAAMKDVPTWPGKEASVGNMGQIKCN